MASTLPAALLESNSKTDNFSRLTRLLIQGGRGVLQLLFDSFNPPAQLSAKLATNKEWLCNSKLLFPDQLEILYPGEGSCVESRNFDITLLSRLFQKIFPPPTPFTEWKDLPNDDDTSVGADFARIKIYRNTIFAHTTKMELDDGTFQELWTKISDALIRLAIHVSEEDGKQWKQAVEYFEKAPLTECDRQHSRSLGFWCKCDGIFLKLQESLEFARSAILKLCIECSSFICLPLSRGRASSSSEPEEPTTAVITNEITNRVMATESPFCSEYLETDLRVKVKKKEKGSLIITVECGSLEILQQFWEEYTSRRLNRMAEKCLVTQELLDRFGLLEVRLHSTVDPAEYRRGRRELILLELGDKVYRDLEVIVGKVEVLIDEGDVSEALKLISDTKTEQEFELQGPASILKFLVDSGAEVGHKTKDGTFPLMIASYQGSADSVKYLLECGEECADVNQVDKFGRTALHVAALYGHVDVANVLIQHGASLNPKDKFGNTPLQLANERSNKDVEKLLLKCEAKACYEPMKLKRLASGALVKIDDALGYNLMHRACMTGDAEFVESILSKHFVDIPVLDDCTAETADEPYRAKSCREIANELNKEGQKKILHTLDKGKIDWESLSELHKAVQRGDVEEVVSLVVDQSMNIDTPANRRETALHWASVNGSVEVVKTLLELGADISAQTDEGLTALHKACLHNNFSVASSLLTKGASTSKENYEGSTALHIAARENVVHIAKLLLDHGASVTERDNKEQTPLHIAARENVVHIAELLLDHGANLTERDNMGQTPLHIAAQLGQNEVSKLFLGKDLNPDLQDSTGCTPLHRAAENNHFAVTEVLIAHKANPHAKDNSGQTPLHLCAAEGHDKVVETLLANEDLDINRQDKMGFTPLHRAAENNKIAVAETLIRHKAAVNAQTKQNLADRIYLVYGQCEGKPSWVYIFVHNFKLAQFEKMAQKESISEIDFNKFGQEILSGYGDKPRDDLCRSIENEASEFVLDNDNETPLHLACKMGHNEIVRLLHEADENLVYQPDAEGFLPFHSAIMYGHVETVRLLLSYSPSLTEESVQVSSAGESMTPVDLAAANDVNMDNILKPQQEPSSYTAERISKVMPKISKFQTKEGQFLSQKFENIFTLLGGEQPKEIDINMFHPQLISA